MTARELAALKRAAEVLDNNDHEILAEQVWYVFENNGGRR